MVTDLIAGRAVGDADIEAEAGALLWTPAGNALSEPWRPVRVGRR